MPCSNTSNLSETLVCLTGELLGSPTGHHTLESLTLGGSNNINLLILSEHSVNGDLLLEEVNGEVNLGGNVSSIDLDLSNVSLLLANVHQSHLGVGNGTDKLGVSLDLGELSVDGSLVGGVLLSILAEGLLLGGVPSLVETATGLISNVLCPDGANGAETLGGLDVSNNTNDDEGRGLQDGDGLNDLLLVHLGSDLVHITDDVGHTGLVSKEGSQVGLLGLVILGESPHLSSVVSSPLFGEETQ